MVSKFDKTIIGYVTNYKHNKIHLEIPQFNAKFVLSTKDIRKNKSNIIVSRNHSDPSTLFLYHTRFPFFLRRILPQIMEIAKHQNAIYGSFVQNGDYFIISPIFLQHNLTLHVSTISISDQIQIEGSIFGKKKIRKISLISSSDAIWDEYKELHLKTMQVINHQISNMDIEEKNERKRFKDIDSSLIADDFHKKLELDEDLKRSLHDRKITVVDDHKPIKGLRCKNCHDLLKENASWSRKGFCTLKCEREYFISS